MACRFDKKLALVNLYSFGLLLVGSLFLNFTVDDAFITFRYGKNIIDHGIWNWNPTESGLVEAYTNPLYAVISVIPHWMGVNVIYIFKILGAALLWGTYSVLAKGLQKFGKAISLAFLATNMLIFPHAFSGLETVAFFLCAFWLMTLSAADFKSPLASSLILIAPMLRPEGAVLSAYIIYRQAVSEGFNKLTVVSLVIGVAYLIVKFNYFGYVFPNTYYAKTGNGLVTMISNVWSERYVIFGWIIGVLVIVVFKGSLRLPVLLFLAYMFGNMTADLQMNYGHRFAWHMLMPTIFYAFWLSCRISGLISCDQEAGGRGQEAGVLAMAVLFVVAVMINLDSGLWGLLVYYPDAMRSHLALGKVLQGYRGKDLVLAVGDAGLIPYHSELETIDYIGLANSEIAHSIKEDREPSLNVPDIIVVFSDSEHSCLPRSFQYKGEKVIRERIKSENYLCMGGPRWGDNYYVNLLVKRDLPGLDELYYKISEVKKYSNGRSKVEHLKDVLTFNGLR